MRQYKVTENMPIVGPVELRCIKVINRRVHGRKRRIKILVNPLNGRRVYGYHEPDGYFVKVNPRQIGLAA